MPIDHKTYRQFKDSIFGRLQKVENYMNEITADPPIHSMEGEESKTPVSPSSSKSDEGKETEMEFEGNKRE